MQNQTRPDLQAHSHVRWTYVARRSTCRYRRLLAPSRSDGSWGTWSTCWPDSSGRPCRSDGKSNTPLVSPLNRTSWAPAALDRASLDAEQDADNIPCTAAQSESRWTFRDPEPRPLSRGRRKRPCRRLGFRSRGPRRNQWTLVLDTEVQMGWDFHLDSRHFEGLGVNGDWPLSQRESCCSVRMDGRLPRLRKMVKSRPIRSVATPAYSSSPKGEEWRGNRGILVGMNSKSGSLTQGFSLKGVHRVWLTDEHRRCIVSRIIRTLPFSVLHLGRVDPEDVVLTGRFN